MFYVVFNAGEDFVILNHLILVAKFYIYGFKLNGVKPAMRVFTTKIGAIHSIESRIAFMRNTCLRQNFMTKNGRKSNVLLIESIPQIFPSVIVIYLFLLSRINID